MDSEMAPTLAVVAVELVVSRLVCSGSAIDPVGDVFFGIFVMT